MRIYLGDVKTPFNKHDLIRTLTAFLRKPETAERILSLIDSKDARVLTAIVLLEEPSMSKLYALFEASVGYLALHYHILNLEERMLVYRDDSEEHSHIRMHPLLAESVIDQVVNPGLIFHFTPQETISTHLSRPTDARIIATTTYVIGAATMLKSDGELRKKASNEINERFAEDRQDAVGEGIRSVTKGLQRLGVLAESAGELSLNLRTWREFCNLDRKSRVAYLVAYAASDPGARVDIAPVIDSILEHMPLDFAMDEASLVKMIRAFAISDLANERIDSIINTLTAIGLTNRVGRDGIIRTAHTRNDHQDDPIFDDTAQPDTDDATNANHTSRETDEQPVIQPTFELHVPITISAGAAWFLPLLTELRNFDTVSRYEITRTACARGFDAGLDAETIVDLLNELCANAVPSNVRTTLMLWEQEFRGVRMVRGTVVVVDESRQHLFEYDTRIQELIHETLHVGVYLVRARDVEPLRKHLEQVGVDPFPDLVEIDEADDDPKANTPAFRTIQSTASQLDSARIAQNFRPRIAPGDPSITGQISTSVECAVPPLEAPRARPAVITRVTRDAYRDEVETYSGVSKLTNAERIEMEERIERRLILFPYQIASIQPISEIVEAKGFDYLGKVRLIEQAITHGHDLLEITRIDEDGKPLRNLIKPDALRNDGSELILVGRAMTGETPVEFRVRTIGVVRKRRGSMLR